MDVEANVRQTYSTGALQVVEALCCPVTYDPSLLALLPAAIIERDYGCGDPSKTVRPGDVVLDLGSGGGKICYMAAQLVGSGGRVIGVDMNDDMLALAREHQAEMARRLGEDRVHFFKGRIQDLALDQEKAEAYLLTHPVVDAQSAEAFELWKQQQRAEHPMIADESVTLVISNCVLNLVDDAHKSQLVAEIYRVLQSGGRVAISDIVADAPIPAHMKENAELWSGCISGAFGEAEFIKAFRQAGFVGVAFDKWEPDPWRVVEGVAFRSVTLTAFKRPVVGQTHLGHAVIYRGPFVSVEDETGGRYPAGVRVPVSLELFERLGMEPFTDCFIRISPDGAKKSSGCGCGPSGC